MFTTPLFNAPIATATSAAPAVSIAQPSESDIRGIFSALQKDSLMSAEQKKVVMAAITEKIGAVSIITALISSPATSSPSTPAISSASTIQEDSESLVEEEHQEEEQEEQEEQEQEEHGAVEGSLEEVDEVLNIGSAKQFPALPKATRRAPSPIRDPIREARAKAASPVHSHEEDEHESREMEVEFKNEPEECIHFFKYGIRSANEGTTFDGLGCRYGTNCAKSHGHKTSRGRSISARTQAQIENGTITCFRCQEPHHVDDCHCKHCGSDRHISSKCPQCYNCGELGHMIRECPESPRESESPRERGVRVVYGTPTAWKY